MPGFPSTTVVAEAIQMMVDVGMGTAGSLDSVGQALSSMQGQEFLTQAANTAQAVASVAAVLSAFTIVGPGVVIGTATIAITLTITKSLNESAPPGSMVAPISIGDLLGAVGNIVAIAGVGLPIGSLAGLALSVAGGTVGFASIFENNLDGGLGSLFQAGIKWFLPSDPLILDLDGDGVELTGTNGAVLFDHNADTVKTGTQWVSADDGILVRDINDNGLIDSGRELFGDQTILTNGQTAANGFAALSDLDSNADGMFDVSDAAYSDLRIWRDLNQDGISQSGELQTLLQAGVTSINLGANAQGASSFTKTTTDADGITVTATQAVRNINFTTNNFYGEFTDDPVVSAAQQTGGAICIPFAVSPVGARPRPCCSFRRHMPERYVRATQPPAPSCAEASTPAIAHARIDSTPVLPLVFLSSQLLRATHYAR